MKIVVTGSIAYDYLMYFPGRFSEHLMAEQLHNVSVSFMVKKMTKKRGGTAPNIAYTIALLGGRPTVMATAGQDFEDYRAFLEAMGVDTSAIMTIPDEYTASFFANTDDDQNQIASFYAGAMAHAGRLSFAEHAPDTRLTIISPNDPGAMQAYARECKTLGIDYIYDPSQQTIWLSGAELAEGISGCRLLTVNQYEFGMIQEKTGFSAADILAQAGGILITNGKQGAQLVIDGEEHYFPAFPPQEVIDPTGAGDAYRAGLMRSMQLGLPWQVAGRVAALCSTYVIENVGTQAHHFTTEQFVARYRSQFDDEGALDLLLTQPETATA